MMQTDQLQQFITSFLEHRTSSNFNDTETKIQKKCSIFKKNLTDWHDLHRIIVNE